MTNKAEEPGLNWETIEQLNDQQLASQFYSESGQFQLPDGIDVHQELTRKGMTMHLLWEEYTRLSKYSIEYYKYL